MKKHRLAGLLLASAFLLTSPFSPIHSAPILNTVEAKTVSEAEEEMAETERKKQEAQDKLDSLNVEAGNVLEEIYALDAEINQYASSIWALSIERNTLQIQISMMQSKLQNAMVKEKNQYKQMKQRIAYAYENGDIDYLNALMAMNDFSNVLNHSEYIEQVSTFDQRQFESLLETRQQIIEYQSILEDALEEINELKHEAEGEQAALEVLQEGKEEILAEYNIMISDTESDIADLQALEDEQAAEIERLTAEYLAAQEAARREREAAAAAQNNSSSGGDSDSGDSDSGDSGSGGDDYYYYENSFSGSFIWPCPSSWEITSYFGYREAPTEGASTYHNGVDIGADYGASVIAAASGTVVTASYTGSGGNTVMIDHGDGVMTIYYHLSGYACSEGQYVSAGQTIAYVGSTGVSTGPHLDFRIYIDGAYYNPLNYF